MTRDDRVEWLEAALTESIVILDGGMGTMIQGAGLGESDYRGERFKNFPHDLKGNNDLLTLTQPDLIASIHRQYVDAGASIIETNTFNSNRPSMADYGMEDHGQRTEPGSGQARPIGCRLLRATSAGRGCVGANKQDLLYQP